jgi:hypothetical protein
MSDSEPIGNTAVTSEFAVESAFLTENRKVVEAVKQKYPHAFVERHDDKGGKISFFPNMKAGGSVYDNYGDRESLDNWHGSVNFPFFMTESGVFSIDGNLSLEPALNLTAIVDASDKLGAKSESDYALGGYKILPTLLVTENDGRKKEYKITQHSLVQSPLLKGKFEKSEELGKMITERREAAEKAKQSYKAEDVLKNL